MHHDQNKPLSDNSQHVMIRKSSTLTALKSLFVFRPPQYLANSSPRLITNRFRSSHQRERVLSNTNFIQDINCPARCQAKSAGYVGPKENR